MVSLAQRRARRTALTAVVAFALVFTLPKRVSRGYEVPRGE